MITQKPLVQQSQEMRLKLSQQNIMALNLLAQTSLELKASIQEALETNPALEIRDEPWEYSLEKLQENQSDDEFSITDPDVSEDLVEALNLEVPPEVPDDAPIHKTHQKQDQNDLTYYDAQSATDLGETSYSDSIQTIIERTLSVSEDLRSHLSDQLVWAKADEKIKNLAHRLIDNLDANGFHIVPPQQLLAEGENHDDLQAALDLVQGLDPLGTCTRNWQESLLVQMKKLGGFSEEAIRLVRDHSALLLNPVPKHISKALKVEVEEVEGILEEIKTLNPFPGKEFNSQSAPEIYPDLFIEEREGEFFVSMNDEIIPVIGFNKEFINEVKDPHLDKISKTFVKQKIKEANDFIQRLLFRQNTLLKVGHAICRRQTEFLRKGPKFLKGLVLSEIAQEVGVHPSTVSRATNGKYIQTKWGILELKEFFSRQSGTGEHSKEAIKDKMKEIMVKLKKNELRLTDRRIQEELAKLGIEVALRTVNKYRRELEN
jgi:RNA polymerase sigma-54 factor